MEPCESWEALAETPGEIELTPQEEQTPEADWTRKDPAANHAGVLGAFGYCKKNGARHQQGTEQQNPKAAKCSECVDEVLAADGLWFPCCGAVYCHRCFAHVSAFREASFKPKGERGAAPVALLARPKGKPSRLP
eukprot:TRINITY_DN29724_c0_g1_i1.p1 TRINITY_DN29724_c0_g1~~TRINITY_DN29724_c0_g1_i1.p1  ORF type:complete len:135 (+),score=14.57 TRINITY_DN29724_c0_g1_i1:64-468(+)